MKMITSYDYQVSGLWVDKRIEFFDGFKLIAIVTITEFKHRKNIFISCWNGVGLTKRLIDFFMANDNTPEHTRYSYENGRYHISKVW